MKLWGGCFTKKTDQPMHNFNESLSFDQKFYHWDIEGGIAHVKTLEKQGILSTEGRDDIIRGLESILSDLDSGALTISSDPGYEDIHPFVEGTLTERTGKAGKRLRTGRSRNDQVALDMKLYTRDEIDEIGRLVKELLVELLVIMEANTDTFIPGFTHLQRAQPITLVHHMGAYFETFSRDRSRPQDIRKRMDYCLLGFGVLAGTTYPLNREYMAAPSGSDGPTLNSMDSVVDKDYLVELLSALSTIAMHPSRLCEEIIIQNTNEYRFVEIDNSCSMSSPIMPQKKNPDITELVRGKSGRVYGVPASLLTTMKGVPSVCNKDMQEGKELTFDAIDTAKGCLALFTGMTSSMSFRRDVMEASAKNGFTNATDVTDYLVNKEVLFHGAHGIMGQLVLLCIRRRIALDDLSLKEHRQISLVSKEDVYEVISMKTYVEKRVTIGAPGQGTMKQVIEVYRQQLAG